MHQVSKEPLNETGKTLIDNSAKQLYTARTLKDLVHFKYCTCTKGKCNFFTQISNLHFLPLLLAATRARVLVVLILFGPCGVLGAPNGGAGEDDANGLPAIPLEPGAKLNPVEGVLGTVRGPETEKGNKSLSSLAQKGGFLRKKKLI